MYIISCRIKFLFNNLVLFFICLLPVYSKPLNLKDIEYYSVKNDIEINKLQKKKNKLLQQLKLKQREFYPSANLDLTRSISKNPYYDKKQYAFSLSYNVYDGNRKLNEKKNINSDIELCELELETKKRNLLYEVRNLYYEIVLINNKLVLINKNITEAEKNLSDMKQKYKLKTIIKLDLIQQKVYIKQLQLNKIRLKNNRKLKMELLKQKLVLKKNITFDFNKNIIYNYKKLLFNDVYKYVLKNNYDYYKIINSMEQNANTKKILDSINKPNLSFSGGYKIDDYLYSGISNTKEWYLNGTVTYNFDSIKFPFVSSLFQFDNKKDDLTSNNDYSNYSISLGLNKNGSQLSNLLNNDNAYLLLQTQKIKTERILYNDVLAKILYNDELKNTYELQKMKIQATREIIRKYEILYGIGKVLMNDLIEKKQELLNDEIELLDVTIKNILNLIYLEKISGKVYTK